MDAMAGHDPGVFAGEGGDHGPLVLVRGIDHGSLQADGAQVGRNQRALRHKLVKMEVLVGVVKRDHGSDAGCHQSRLSRSRKWPLWGKQTTEGTTSMMDNLIIDIPELRLPRDMAWRVKFIEAVEQHAGRLGISGRFKVPRFFGYYFTGSHAVVVAGLWTVLVDDAALLRR